MFLSLTECINAQVGRVTCLTAVVEGRK